MKMSKKIRSRKRFFSKVAAVILGESKQLNIKGSKSEINALREVMYVTRGLHYTLNKNDSKLSSVVNLIQRKHVAAQNFEDKFGFRWIL